MAAGSATRHRRWRVAAAAGAAPPGGPPLGGGRGAAGPPQAVAVAVVVGDLAPWGALRVRGQGAGGPAPGIGEQREDRREVGPGGALEAEAVLLRPRMGPLVGADAAGAVVLDPDPGQEPPADELAPVGRPVVLLEGPDGGLVADDGALPLPAAERLGRGGVGIVALGEVDVHGVERRARGQVGPALGVDDVVGRAPELLERPGDVLVVAQRGQRGD